jgi:hypothetical protein
MMRITISVLLFFFGAVGAPMGGGGTGAEDLAAWMGGAGGTLAGGTGGIAAGGTGGMEAAGG